MSQLTCDRTSLMMWADGVLLRNEGGSYAVCDERACLAAEEALASGETVLLTVGGRVVTQIKEKSGKWVEEPLSP